MHIIIPGPIPSKKNSRVGLNIKGRLINVPNGDFRKWHRRASLAIAPQIIGKPTIEKCSSISILFFMSDNRGRAYTNVAESVMDLLVDCEVIKDDQWQVTGPVHLLPGCPDPIDRTNPRAEVFINE